MNNQNKLASFFIQQKFIVTLEKWAIPIMSIALSFFLIYEGYVTYGMYGDYQVKIEERNALSASLSSYKNNKLLSEEEKALYGSILAKQIPAKENIFATYTFVDEFIASSGLEIEQYGETNVPLAGSAGVNTLGISVSGIVTPERFKEFLDEYKYKYSRFMVMKNMNKTLVDDGSGQQTVSFTASFSLYSIPSVTSIGKDLSALRLISFDKSRKDKFDKIKLLLNEDNYVEKEETEEDISTEYETNESLF